MITIDQLGIIKLTKCFALLYQCEPTAAHFTEWRAMLNHVEIDTDAVAVIGEMQAAMQRLTGTQIAALERIIAEMKQARALSDDPTALYAKQRAALTELIAVMLGEVE